MQLAHAHLGASLDETPRCSGSRRKYPGAGRGWKRPSRQPGGTPVLNNDRNDDVGGLRARGRFTGVEISISIGVVMG